MSKNFNLKTRSMRYAGILVLESLLTEKIISYASNYQYKKRWIIFCDWAEIKGVKKMELINYDLIKSYSQYLKTKIHNEEISFATAHVYISAINSVMNRASPDYKKFSPTKDGRIPVRNHVRGDLPSMYHRDAYEDMLKQLEKRFEPRKVIILELAREMGLRVRECSLLNTIEAYESAISNGFIVIKDGPKNGRSRQIKIISERQVDVLLRASKIQDDHFALIPPDINYKHWYHSSLKKMRKAVKEISNGPLHDLRASYACERYLQLTNKLPPCSGNLNISKKLDLEARQIITQELGHGRISVVASYVGTRRLKNEK